MRVRKTKHILTQNYNTKSTWASPFTFAAGKPIQVLKQGFSMSIPDTIV